MNNLCWYNITLQNGDDNMTIIIVAFPGAPAISQEAIQAEQDLDANLERLLKGSFCFLSAHENICSTNATNLSF